MEFSTYVELSLEVGLLALKFGLFVQELADVALGGFKGEHEVVLFLKEVTVGSLKFLAELSLSFVVLQSLGGLLLEGADLVLDSGDIEKRLDLLPETVPGPGAELQVFPQVALDNDKGYTLFLQLLEFLTREVTTDPGLKPGDDLGQAVVTDFFKLTQDTSPEEDLQGGLGGGWGIMLEVNVASFKRQF